ncbi:MAG: GspH/FimT family pseudopilin [Hydrogenothermaceae bacterium]|nr:GspH/FimT family pseudopilin [Hydrogenothermaceae bacterium]
MKIKGFTLIEVLVVTAIVAILIKIAIPHIRSYYQMYKYNSYVGQVEYVLKWSRLEAMSRSKNMGICVENNGVSVYDMGYSRSGFCSGTLVRRVDVDSGDNFVQISGTSGMGFDPRGLAIMGGNIQIRNGIRNECVRFNIQTLRGSVRRENC